MNLYLQNTSVFSKVKNLLTVLLFTFISFNTYSQCTITAQPVSTQLVNPNIVPSALIVVATGNNLTYQWYKNLANNNTNGTLIPGATSASFTPPSSNTVGATYYYVKVIRPSFTCISAVSEVRVACSVQVSGETFSAADGVSKTFNQPPTNYGFTFDIFTLDNSFNMTINGTSLAFKTGFPSTPAELQFQSSATPGINVKFKDGDLYETNTGIAGSRNIWQLTGNQATPILRVVISPTGAVSLFGSKVSGGSLFPLELFNGATLNTIVWNSAANNVIVISQLVTGPTYINGRGYGVNLVTCLPCYTDGSIATEGVTGTRVGITTLKRAGSLDTEWPGVRKSSFVAIESNTKGFVLTRMTSNPALPLAENHISKITNPQEGMMVYDIFTKCLKLYDGVKWDCFNLPTCP